MIGNLSLDNPQDLPLDIRRKILEAAGKIQRDEVGLGLDNLVYDNADAFQFLPSQVEELNRNLSRIECIDSKRTHQTKKGIGLRSENLGDKNVLKRLPSLIDEELTRAPSRTKSFDFKNDHRNNEIVTTNKDISSTLKRNEVENKEETGNLHCKNADAFPFNTDGGITKTLTRNMSFDLGSVHMEEEDDATGEGEIIFSTPMRKKVFNKETMGLLDVDTSIDPFLEDDADLKKNCHNDPRKNCCNAVNLIDIPKINNIMDLQNNKNNMWRKGDLLVSASKSNKSNQNQVVIVGEKNEPDMNLMAYLDVANDLYYREVNNRFDPEQNSVTKSKKNKNRTDTFSFKRKNWGDKRKQEQEKLDPDQAPNKMRFRGLKNLCLWRVFIPFSSMKRQKSFNSSPSSFDLPTLATYSSRLTPPPTESMTRSQNARKSMNDLQMRRNEKDLTSFPFTDNKNEVFPQSLKQGDNNGDNEWVPSSSHFALKTKRPLSSGKDGMFLSSVIGDTVDLFKIVDDLDEDESISIVSENSEDDTANDTVIGKIFSCITSNPCSPVTIFSSNADDEESLYSV